MLGSWALIPFWFKFSESLGNLTVYLAAGTNEPLHVNYCKVKLSPSKPYIQPYTFVYILYGLFPL